MKDRFSDTSKEIFDSRDFEEIQNAIGQLEEIISRSRRGRTRGDGDASSTSTHPSTSTLVDDDGKRPKHSSGKESSTREHRLETPHGAKSININNNSIIIPLQSSSKSNGNGKKTGSQPNIPSAIVTPIASKDSIDNSKIPFGKKADSKKPVVLIATPLPKSSSTSANHAQPSTSSASGSGYTTYQLKKSSSSSAALSSGGKTATKTLTTTAILHTHNAPDSDDDDTPAECNKTASESASGADSCNYVRATSVIKANGILKKSMTASSSSNHHASQPKGTATVSTDTTRSGSKTPEITITPGSGGDHVHEFDPAERLLLSTSVLARVSPEDLPDSGCTGLLDEDDEDNCSLQRAGSSSTAGEQTLACVGGNQSSSPGVGAAGVSGRASSGTGVSGDRDSGGGSVASSCGGGGNSSTGGGYQQQRSAKTGVDQQREVVYAQLQKRRSLVNGTTVPSCSSPVYAHQLQKHLQQQLPLLHVDGPLDGSPYAIVNPLVKHKALADSGISVDQMKDLDRLLNALVQEAESIDIPYHARQDSLPFSYTAPPGPAPSSAPPSSKRSPYAGGLGGSGTSSSGRYGLAGTSSSFHHHQSQYGSSAPINASSSSGAGGSRYRGLEHSISTPGGTRLSSSVSSHSYQQQVPQYYHHQSALEDQIVNPEPISSYSRSVSRHQSLSGSNNAAAAAASRIGARSSDHQQGYRVRPSLSSTSFNAAAYGNGTPGGGNTTTTRRLRSQSADGRRESEHDEDADEWLARQMKRLQEKRASKNAPRSDWLAELKRALPAATAGGTGAGATPSAIANATTISSNQSRSTTSVNEYRPYTSTREEIAASSAISSVLGGAASGGVGGRRSHVSYSSEDDDDVELEMFQRGRRIQRHYSESAYDRQMASASSTRAPSQLSNVVETPFPTCPPTPYFNQRPASPGKPPRSPKGIRRQLSSGIPVLQEMPSRMERAQTPVNPRPVYMVDSEVKFAQDLSEHWYKPFASREETVTALVNQGCGAFLIRNSNSFPGAFGLAVKVTETAGDKGIRHFLIEPTRFGVRLRGSPLEPVFSSLSALVYAHSIDPLALPTTLTLPSFDILPKSSQSTTALLLRQGAACQLLFLGITSVECLTGDEAIHRGISQISGKSPIPISLRLSKHGLTLTDVFRKQFFRLHFALNDISYASLVPGRSVAYGNEVKQVFGIVARAPRATENSVIVLAELEQGQPANAIVSFILRVIAWQH